MSTSQQSTSTPADDDANGIDAAASSSSSSSPSLMQRFALSSRRKRRSVDLAATSVSAASASAPAKSPTSSSFIARLWNTSKTSAAAKEATTAVVASSDAEPSAVPRSVEAEPTTTIAPTQAPASEAAVEQTSEVDETTAVVAVAVDRDLPELPPQPEAQEPEPSSPSADVTVAAAATVTEAVEAEAEAESEAAAAPADDQEQLLGTSSSPSPLGLLTKVASLSRSLTAQTNSLARTITTSIVPTESVLARTNSVARTNSIQRTPLDSASGATDDLEYVVEQYANGPAAATLDQVPSVAPTRSVRTMESSSVVDIDGAAEGSADNIPESVVVVADATLPDGATPIDVLAEEDGNASAAGDVKDDTKEKDDRVSLASAGPAQVIVPDENVEEKPVRGFRRIGAYFRRMDPIRFACIIITAVVLFVVLVLLAIIAYFYFPRFPLISVLSLKLMEAPDGSSPFTFYLDPNSTNYNTLNLHINFMLNVSLVNPNMYDIFVDKIDLGANLVVNTTAISKALNVTEFNLETYIGLPPTGRDPSYVPSNTPKIGTGSVGGLLFPSKTNVTFLMPFSFSYHPETEVGLIADPAFSEVLNVCGVTSRDGKPRSARVTYAAVSTVNKLKWLNYAPKVENSLRIKCPVTTDQIVAFVNEVKTDNGKHTILDLLKEVFSGVSLDGVATPGGPPSTTSSGSWFSFF